MFGFSSLHFPDSPPTALFNRSLLLFPRKGAVLGLGPGTGSGMTARPALHSESGCYPLQDGLTDSSAEVLTGSTGGSHS